MSNSVQLEINSIDNRILLLKSRKTDNGNIIKKLERRKRTLIAQINN
jgi:hypothetical protein